MIIRSDGVVIRLHFRDTVVDVGGGGGAASGWCTTGQCHCFVRQTVCMTTDEWSSTREDAFQFSRRWVKVSGSGAQPRMFFEYLLVSGVKYSLLWNCGFHL